jgi:NADPH:quinone reductase-like Zn-dependent oxidoreductase
VLLDYTAGDWDAAARQATGGRGVDFIVETGGAGTLGRGLRSCAVGGCVTLVGSSCAGCYARAGPAPSA